MPGGRCGHHRCDLQRREQAELLAETAIDLDVGGEVIAGSSRMNAGTAQKITLNTLSTSPW